MDQELLRFGYWLVFFGTIVESDTTLLASSFLAHRGYFHLPYVVGLAFLATALANQAFFWVGGRHRHTVSQLALMRSARAQQVLDWVRQRGPLVVIGSRFLFGIKLVVPIACGITGMSRGAFLTLNVIASFLWALAFAFIGYTGSQMVDLVWRDLRHYEPALLAVLVTGIALFGLLRWRERSLGLAYAALVPSSDLPLWLLNVLDRAGKPDDSNPAG